MGPVLFSLAIHPLVSRLVSVFNVWYLDDGTLGCSPQAESASLLAALEEVDKLDGSSVSEQVKSQISGKSLLRGMRVMPSGLLPSSRHTPKHNGLSH